ncbi:hypothetical protein EIP91_007162 [Steccherinum ochraceum]|uniref:DUF6699 domain-containing protein n=1 Tax=Steccherinum ochraceum TaxID=92696 RepID=A0A4R0RUT6_9APHY|nr:hypothetical protein EIP91_007162 [Steccherinum ochraceum]
MTSHPRAPRRVKSSTHVEIAPRVQPKPSMNSVRSRHSPVVPASKPLAYAHAQPRSSALHMHPILSHTRNHHAPISYDIMYTPSAHSVLDRTTQSAIPSHTLTQPATEPPMATSSSLILRSHKLPWTVVVGSRSSQSKSKAPSSHAITNLDVLYAVHMSLLKPVTPAEWDSLGHGSEAQAHVTKAYERRCTRMGGGWENGVKRIDWLGSKMRLMGIEVDKTAGVPAAGIMVFG